MLKESLSPEIIWTLKRSHFSVKQRGSPSPKWLIVTLLKGQKEAPFSGQQGRRQPGTRALVGKRAGHVEAGADC